MTYIQKSEGFFIKKINQKYIFYNQTFMSDIVKTEKLYPRIISKYNKNLLCIYEKRNI